jgi:hypothetical protein
VSARLRCGVDTSDSTNDLWTLDRIADTYELIASLQGDSASRRSSAFVAGTAQQIIARRLTQSTPEAILPFNIDRNRVDPTVAATVLFLSNGKKI